MENIINQWISYDSGTGRYSYSPWYGGKNRWGGRLVSAMAFAQGCVPTKMGIAYEDDSRDAYIMYPRPFHLIARFVHRLGDYGWKVMRALYWVGLIDIAEYECFRWRDFYRIKSH